MKCVTKVLAQCRQQNSGLRILGSTLINHSSTSATEDIVIPKRIYRSPTDILKALNETIKRDPTAPAYKYQDDPYLTPVSAGEKRGYALACESGRKAARWVRDQHPELFQQMIAVPEVESYKPKEKVTDKTPVSEKMLNDLINLVRVEDAIKAFELLQQNGESLSMDTLQSLLELVGYYNGRDPPLEEDVEERWMSKDDANTSTSSVWNGAALERIFQAIETPSPASYSALICSMLLYGEPTRANELVNKCRSQGIPLDIRVYNYLISSTTRTYGTFNVRWERICGYLKMMKEDKVRPNARIFNAVLNAVRGTALTNQRMQVAFETLGEMRALGIKPSLETYKLLLELMQLAGVSHVPLLKNILDEIKKGPLEIVHANDLRFFVQAMTACNVLYKDLELAREVDDLLNKVSTHECFIGNSFLESVYYRHYMSLLCETAPWDQLWSVYDALVPNIYSPELSVINKLLLVVEKNNRPDYIDRLLKYMQASAQTNQQLGAERLLGVCVNVGAGEDAREYTKQFANIADGVMANLTTPSKTNISGRLTLSDELAGAAMVLLARDGRMQDVKSLIDLYQTNSLTVEQTIKPKYLKELADIAVEKQDFDVLLWVIQLSSSTGSKDVRVTNVIAKLCRRTELPPQISRSLAQIVGDDTLKKIKEENPVGLPEDNVSSGSSASSSSSSSSDSEGEGEGDSASDEELGIKK